MYVASAFAGAAASAVVGGLLSSGSSSRAASASSGANAASQMQAHIASEQWDKYLELYEPMEKQYVQQAQEYGSDANYQKAAGDASATVGQQFGKARAQLERTPGLDPSSAAYQAGMTKLGLGEAATDATQQNTARKNVTDTAWARKTDALSLGKGLPAAASTGLASAASTQSAIAGQQLGLANTQAANGGALVNNLFTAANKAGWLGGNSGNTGAGLDVANTASTYSTPVQMPTVTEYAL